MGTDKKEQALVKRLHGEIVSGEYDEETVRNLFITIREHAADKTPVREYGHFIAHRERDRGAFHDYVRSRMKEVEAQVFGGKNAIHLETPAYTVDELRTSLNQVLAKFGCAPITEEQANQIAVAIVSILQHVNLKSAKGNVAELVVFVSPKHFGPRIESEPTFIYLNGRCPFKHQGKDVTVSFRVFEAENRHYYVYNGHPHEFSGIAHVTCTGGKLTIADEV